MHMTAIFVNGLVRNKQYLQRAFYRYFLLSLGSSGQVVSEKKIFRNRPTINKNYTWLPCLLTDRNEVGNIYRGPSQIIHTKFRFIWPSGIRGKEFKKSANQKQESPVVAMFVNGSGRNEHSLQRTFHRCFLPSFGF